MLPILFVYTVCNLVTSVGGAPALSRDISGQRKLVNTKNNDIAKISWKKVPYKKTDTTSIILELNHDADDVIAIEDFFARAGVKSRKDKSSRERRHVIASDGLAEDILPSGRNKRSTTAAMLSAMINLCDNHRNLCQSIKIRDRDVKTTIRLEEM